MKILVTGGAGFIGSHLVDRLVRMGHDLRVLDALVLQVHGDKPVWPARLPSGVELQHGDVSNVAAWQQALDRVDAVYHLAAEVGVGQSMYEIVRYMSANTMGTAFLLELLASGKYPLKKLIVASSMSIYGEGAYLCGTCSSTVPLPRALERLERRQWEVICANCHHEMTATAASEHKPLQPTSVYAISKRDQEELCLNVGRAYNIPTVALRFFNVYGPGQSLSNPYTGVAAIFASRLLNNRPPLVFEDGRQTRDFVHVTDVVQGLALALQCAEADYQALNIGSGEAHRIIEVAIAMAEALQVPIAPHLPNKYRVGDIRHCFADIGKAKRLLGYAPEIKFADGIRELAEWVRAQTAIDHVEQAERILEQRGLAR